MLGEFGGKQLMVKGAESWGVLLFLVDTGNAVARRLSPEVKQMMEAGQCLIDLVTCFHTNALIGPIMPSDQIDLCYSLYSRYLFLTADIPALVFPKDMSCAMLLSGSMITATRSFSAIGMTRPSTSC